MNEPKKFPYNVVRLPWPGAEGCFLLLSCRETDKNGNGVLPAVSFLRVVGDVAAEWEPTNGSISVFYRGNAKNGEAHYAFPWVRTPGLDWSQLSVEREGLPGLANSGNYAGVFGVLRQWADREPPEENSDGQR
jgi:hypothetical protein